MKKPISIQQVRVLMDQLGIHPEDIGLIKLDLPTKRARARLFYIMNTNGTSPRHIAEFFDLKERFVKGVIDRYKKSDEFKELTRANSIRAFVAAASHPTTNALPRLQKVADHFGIDVEEVRRAVL